MLNVLLERPPGSDYTVEPSPLKIIVIILFTIAFILTLTTHTGQRELHSNKQDFNLLNVIMEPVCHVFILLNLELCLIFLLGLQNSGTCRSCTFDMWRRRYSEFRFCGSKKYFLLKIIY